MRRALLAVLLFGCSGDPVPPRPRPATPVQSAEASQPPPRLSESCERAVACCEAYAARMPNVSAASACAGAREDDEAACARMRRGWRAALAHMGEAPASCAE